MLLLTLLVGDWVVAGQAARQMLEDRLSSTAKVAAQSIPFFLETGQNLVVQLSTDQRLLASTDPELSSLLGQRVQAVPFFEELFVIEELTGSSEVIPTRLFVLKWTLNGCGEELFHLEFSGGIGDITVHDFDGDTCPEIAVEEGSEETGGNVALYRLTAGIPFLISKSQVLDSPGRIISLNIPGRHLSFTKGGQHLIGFGTPDGRFGIIRLSRFLVLTLGGLLGRGVGVTVHVLHSSNTYLFVGCLVRFWRCDS